LGFIMFALLAVALYFNVRNLKLIGTRFGAILPFTILLPYISNSTGWILTEMGRQPWIVYGLMKTQAGFSPNLTPGMVLATLIVYTLVYALLMAADIYLLAKYAKAGAAPDASTSHAEENYE